MASAAEASPERVLLADSLISPELHGLVSFELAGWSWMSVDELVGDIELVSVGSVNADCDRLTAAELSNGVTAADESIQLMQFDRSLDIIDGSFSNLLCLETTVPTEVLRGLYLGASRLEDITGIDSDFNSKDLLAAIDGTETVEMFYGGQWSGAIGEDAVARPQIWIDGVLEPSNVSQGVHLVQLIEQGIDEVYSAEYVTIGVDTHLLWAERVDAHNSLSFRLSRSISSTEPSPSVQALERISGANIYRVVESLDAAIVRRGDGSTVVTIMAAPERKIIGFGLGIGASGGLVGDPKASGTAWLRYSPYLGINFVTSIEGGLSAELLPPEHPDFWSIREQWTLLGGVRLGAAMGISGWEFGGDIARRLSADNQGIIGYRFSSGAFRSAWENTGVRTMVSGTKWPENWDVSLNIGLEWSR